MKARLFIDGEDVGEADVESVTGSDVDRPDAPTLVTTTVSFSCTLSRDARLLLAPESCINSKGGVS